MKTLKDDLVTLKILNELFSEDTKVLFTSDKRLKQAIKDLKDKLFIKTKKGRIVIPACKIIPTIDEVMGVWEE